MKPNKKFELSVKDLELIESALFNAQTKADQTGKREIQQLLAKLYHQKNWYRPENAIYVGG
jgi:hypothetical protein